MVICESGEGLVRTRTLFLRIVSVCYAMAFISLYPQVPGLYGPNGVLPVYMVLKQNTESSTLNVEKLANQVTTLRLLQDISLTTFPHYHCLPNSSKHNVPKFFVKHIWNYFY